VQTKGLDQKHDAIPAGGLGGELDTIVNSVIKPIVRRKLHASLSPTDTSRRNQDALELVQDVQLQLLSEIRNRNGDRAILDLPAYSATVTFNNCYQYLRSRFPERTRLRNKLRYILSHDPAFGLWKNSSDDWLCGSAEHRGSEKNVAIRAAEVAAQTLESDRNALTALLAGYLSKCDGPVLFDDMVDRFAAALGISEPFEVSDDADDIYDRYPDSSPGIDAVLESAAGVKTLWNRILELPPEHRKALLLNLRDTGGENALVTLWLTRSAGLRDIAAALEISIEKLTEIWNSLPWDDLRIAEHLGRTRQQVINLRQTARAKLMRWRRTGNI
jgi:DNA-directed RNA polymerase specialized sigma24 family protein